MYKSCKLTKQSRLATATSDLHISTTLDFEFAFFERLFSAIYILVTFEMFGQWLENFLTVLPYKMYVSKIYKNKT